VFCGIWQNLLCAFRKGINQMNVAEIVRRLIAAGYQAGIDFVIEIEDLPQPELWVYPAVAEWIQRSLPNATAYSILGEACGSEGCALPSHENVFAA